MENINLTKEDLLKEEFLEQLFKEQKCVYSYRGKKYMNVKLVCLNRALNKHLHNLLKKFGKNHTYDEFMSEYILWAWKAINGFEIKDEGSWEGIVDGSDTPNIGRLIQNIKVTTQHQIYRFVNADAKFTKGEVDGEKGQHIVVKMEFESLDAVLEGNAETLETLTDSHSLFNNTMYSYYITYFQKWYEENKLDILTKGQIKFLDDLKKCVKIEGYTSNDVKEVTGTSSDAVNKRLNRISKRIEDAWLKQNPNYKNKLEMERDKKVELWQGFLTLINDENADLTSMNLMVTNWLAERLETDEVEELVHGVLEQEEMILLNRIMKAGGKHPITLKGKALYKIVDAVEKRVEELQQQTFKFEPVKKAPNQQLKMWYEQKKIRDNQEAFVFNMEGEYIRAEEHKGHKRKNNIIYVLPSGMRIATDGVLL